jgi:hypothetical protein
MNQIFKYPRTPHLQGSRLQPGDEDLEAAPFAILEGQHVVVTEKMDGANSGISFSEEGKLQLQSRGHYLTGGAREKHFDRFKSWAHTWIHALRELLGSRYLMYGEWLYAKHTIFYNRLPDYFMEFDILDTQNGTFLSTSSRREMLADYPFVHSAKVLYEGNLTKPTQLKALLGPSAFISEGHLSQLHQQAEAQGLRAEQVLKETDPTRLMEGLYLKTESESEVMDRYKFVRASFLQAVQQSESHWLNRPIVPNQRRGGDLV